MSERTEERLRAALRAEVADVDMSADAWTSVQRGVRAARRRSLAVRGTVIGAAAAVVAVVVGIGVLRDGDDGTTVVTPADTSTSSTVGTTTTTTPAPTQPEVEGIWPFTSREDIDAYLADPGVGLFRDAEQTALEFAREYLGMPDPVAVDGPRVAETGEVAVSVVTGRGPATRVWMHEVDGVHTVYFAETDNIRVDPTTFTGPIVRQAVGVVGTSTSFEAHVDVEVRDADGNVLGRSYVMGGANGELLPFAGEIPIEAPTTPTGAVILSTSSAEDGSLSEATVVLLRFAAGSQFSVFFHRGEELVEVARTGPRTVGVLRQALEALVAGPTADEQAAGLGSLFSEETADVLAGVTIRDDGTAIVDLAETVNNASTAAGSEAFLAELNATVLQFPTVERVEYRLRGSCEAFWTWLQVGECQVIARPAN